MTVLRVVLVVMALVPASPAARPANRRAVVKRRTAGPAPARLPADPPAAATRSGHRRLRPDRQPARGRAGRALDEKRLLSENAAARMLNLACAAMAAARGDTPPRARAAARQARWRRERS